MDFEADAGRLLDQLDVLRHPSDLDLLMFFARHPRALLASEHLGTFLGYGAKEIAASLDLLMEAGFLTRTPNPRHSARMYELAGILPGGGWLPRVRQMASTREGRLALIGALRRRALKTANGPTSRERGHATTFPPLPFRQGRISIEHGRRKRVASQASTELRRQGGRDGER